MLRRPSSHPVQPSAPSAALAGRSLLNVACETLALGCLFERRGGVHIRVPVQRRQQASGCEWHGRRSGGALVRVSYTFDPAEEWVALWRRSPERVAVLYRRILDCPTIEARDLGWRSDMYVRTPDGHALAFPAGSYNPFNVWNTARGAVHLNGLVREGFEETAPPPPAVVAPVDLPGRGLLFLGDRDRTAEVLRAVRPDGAGGPARRIEVAAPPGAPWSLEDMTLPDGEGFTPLGLFRALLRGAPGPDAGPRGDESWPGPWATAGLCLPGGLIADAMLRRIGRRPAEEDPAEAWPGRGFIRRDRGAILEV